MDCKVNGTIVNNRGNTAVQEIGYLPDFFAPKSNQGFYIPNGSIYIYGVSKIKWIHDGHCFNQSEKIEYYNMNEPDKYADLLELLQGLVVPIKKD